MEAWESLSQAQDRRASPDSQPRVTQSRAGVKGRRRPPRWPPRRLCPSFCAPARQAWTQPEPSPTARPRPPQTLPALAAAARSPSGSKPAAPADGPGALLAWQASAHPQCSRLAAPPAAPPAPLAAGPLHLLSGCVPRSDGGHKLPQRGQHPLHHPTLLHSPVWSCGAPCFCWLLVVAPSLSGHRRPSGHTVLVCRGCSECLSVDDRGEAVTGGGGQGETQTSAPTALPTSNKPSWLSVPRCPHP